MGQKSGADGQENATRGGTAERQREPLRRYRWPWQPYSRWHPQSVAAARTEAPPRTEMLRAKAAGHVSLQDHGSITAALGTPRRMQGHHLFTRHRATLIVPGMRVGAYRRAITREGQSRCVRCRITTPRGRASGQETWKGRAAITWARGDVMAGQVYCTEQAIVVVSAGTARAVVGLQKMPESTYPRRPYRVITRCFEQRNNTRAPSLDRKARRWIPRLRS